MQGEKDSKVIPSSSFLRELEKKSGESVSSCFQCMKCTSGCPAGFAMDYVPHELIHMIHGGLEDEELKSSALWVCTACETCFTRCPNEISIPQLMKILGQMAIKSGIVLKNKKVPVFNEVFLKSIENRGRIHELEMIQKYTLKSGDLIKKLKPGELTKDAKLAWEMYRRGKVRLFAKGIKGKKEIKNIFLSAEGRR